MNKEGTPIQLSNGETIETKQEILFRMKDLFDDVIETFKVIQQPANEYKANHYVALKDTNDY